MTGSDIGGVIAILVPFAIAAFVIYALVWGKKSLARRDAKLAEIAQRMGLAVGKSAPGAISFLAEGNAGEMPIRIAYDLVDLPHRHDEELFRVVARPTAPRPSIVLHRRGGHGPYEATSGLHEISTKDDTLDERFTTYVEDDAVARDFIAGVRALLLALSERGVSGVQSFKVGSEVAVVIACSLDPQFFDDGRADQAVELVLQASRAPDAG